MIFYGVMLGGIGKDCGKCYLIVGDGVFVLVGVKVFGLVEIGVGVCIGVGVVVLKDVFLGVMVVGIFVKVVCLNGCMVGYVVFKMDELIL